MSELTYSNAVENPAQAPSVTKELAENVILTCVDDLYDWARFSTLYPMTASSSFAKRWQEKAGESVMPMPKPIDITACAIP
jgi:hypothetical protein